MSARLRVLPWFVAGLVSGVMLVAMAYATGWSQGIVDATPSICMGKVDSVVVRRR